MKASSGPLLRFQGWFYPTWTSIVVVSFRRSPWRSLVLSIFNIYCLRVFPGVSVMKFGSIHIQHLLSSCVSGDLRDEVLSSCFGLANSICRGMTLRCASNLLALTCFIPLSERQYDHCCLTSRLVSIWPPTMNVIRSKNAVCLFLTLRIMFYVHELCV